MTYLPLNQLTDYLYEIPKVGAMRVPGRIYASPSLIESAKQDESLQQVMNVAQLPGIVSHALAMPDFHWGYGFPIGGVAAFDAKDGIVSPGGVGYDINCLSGDARVLFPEGFTRPIRDVVRARSTSPISLFDLRARKRVDAPVIAGMSSRPRRPVWEFLTSTGRTLVATEDHPVLTPDGMREVGRLQPGDRMAVLPFEGVPYEKPSGDIIVSADDLQRIAGPGADQMLRHLAPLLPLTYDHPALPVLIKAAGLILGDGSIHREKGSGKLKVSVTGKKGDLEALARDLLPWTKVSKVYARKRSHRIATTYGPKEFDSTEHFVHITSSGFALLLHALGLPVGTRSNQDWGVPAFLSKAPPWQKRLFLAAFFGAEMTSPDAFVKRNRNFKCPVLTVVKRDAWIESGRRFLGEIAAMLREFGVGSLTVSQRSEQVNPDGSQSVRLRLVVSSRIENLIALWTRVGFEYNAGRSETGLHAAAYLQWKKKIVEARDRVRHRILEIRALGGWGAAKIHAALGEVTVNRRFVERTIYERPDRLPRTPEDCATFDEWLPAARRGLRGGAVWEEIRAKTPRPDVRKVFDVTVDHRDHNFIANGFVVHNCGVRLMRTNLKRTDLKDRLKDVLRQVFRDVPAGVGSDGAVRTPSKDEAAGLVTRGAQWAVEQGYGTQDDLLHIEEGGRLAGAEPDAVPKRAYERGLHQIGSLGSGNHFLEIQVVDEVYLPKVAARFGLELDGIAVAIHSGSRGFGHQVCEESLAEMMRASRKYGIDLPDRQLCCAPLSSPEAQRYLGAMFAAANFAFANRQVMKGVAEKAIAKALGRSLPDLGMKLVYDVCHNIAKFETHEVDGVMRKLCVHRKGATRALPPNHPLVPEAYRDLGQPVLVPGDMGRASFLLIGNARASKDTFASTCHGAGRRHSRSAMKKMMSGRDMVREMQEKHGVIVMGHSREGLAEEMPEAYKNVTDVVDVMEKAGISDKVVRLRPLACMKG